MTTKQVREVFDVDHTQVLVEYFLALADGDFARQTQLMSDWGEPPAEKVKWVSAFLLALYYNDLLGKQLVVDALIHSIQQQERVEILDGFQKRLGFANRKDLEFCWPKMLEYWVAPTQTSMTLPSYCGSPCFIISSTRGCLSQGLRSLEQAWRQKRSSDRSCGGQH